jgi:hypothetical protein
MIVRLAIALFVLSAIFWLLERWRPALRTTARRGVDTRVDLAYWFFTPVVTRAVTRVAVGLAFVLMAWTQGVTLDDLRRLATSRRTGGSATSSPARSSIAGITRRKPRDSTRISPGCFPSLIGHSGRCTCRPVDNPSALALRMTTCRTG